MNNELSNLKMTKNQRQEVIKDAINNLSEYEIKQLLLHLLEDNNNNKLAYNFMTNNYKNALLDSLKYNSIIEE